jgi:acyl-CoA synthetase (AMP-forming)/AMP-acid ligase II
MDGTMMDFPLVLPVSLERAGKVLRDVEIASYRPDETVRRSSFQDFCIRARQLAKALQKLGLQAGERVACLMWNHEAHLEAFSGVPCAGLGLRAIITPNQVR